MNLTKKTQQTLGNPGTSMTDRFLDSTSLLPLT